MFYEPHAAPSLMEYIWLNFGIIDMGLPYRYEISTELVPLCIRNTSFTPFGQKYYVDSESTFLKQVGSEKHIFFMSSDCA